MTFLYLLLILVPGAEMFGEKVVGPYLLVGLTGNWERGSGQGAPLHWPASDRKAFHQEIQVLSRFRLTLQRRFGETVEKME